MKIGIIGAGQLGRMMALAGYPLGAGFVFLDSSRSAPGAPLGDFILAEFDDGDKLRELADRVDLLTFDVENVPAELLHDVAQRVVFLPPVAALENAQDRLREKRMFRRLGIPTPEFRAVDSRQDLHAACASVGLPAVLKTRRLGYDGKGQRMLRGDDEIDAAWDQLGQVPLILESFVRFEREVSLVGARSTQGETRFYPLTDNVHEDGILRTSSAPFHAPEMQKEAETVLLKIMDDCDYAGVLTVEFFVLDGMLMANEIAPRVHNSGHWTIEGAVTSQFENHLRAIAGLPLGDTAARGHSVMVNFLGTMPAAADILNIRGAHLHDYGKSPRPLRKLGHCTITADTPEELEIAWRQLQDVL